LMRCLDSHCPTPVPDLPTPAEPYTTWRTPASAATSATFLPCRISASRPLFMGFWTLKTPWEPSRAAPNETRSSMSALTTWAPAAASALALGPSGLRVTALTCQPSARSCRAVAPPMRPVAPSTAIVPLALIRPPDGSRSRLHNRAEATPARGRGGGCGPWPDSTAGALVPPRPIQSDMLHTLGGLRPLGEVRQPKLLLLLSYLALEGSTPRSSLARLFWPQSPRPLSNLSVALSALRGRLPGVLEADADRVGAKIVTDAQEFLSALADGDEALAAKLYRGPFLLGVESGEL